MPLAGTGGDDIILKGAIPFKDLLMKVEDTLDPYGNKFNYAVSYNLTPGNAAAFNAGWGNISVQKLQREISNDGSVWCVDKLLLNNQF